MLLDPVQLEQFRFSANLIDQSVICIEDSPNKPICFASKLDVLGYKDADVIGLPFNETFLPKQLLAPDGSVIKEDFHAFHDGLMRQAAQTVRPGSPTVPMGSRSVQILHRDKKPQFCKVQISYIGPPSEGHCGIFMAVCAFEGDIAPEQAEKIQNALAHLVRPAEVIRSAKAAVWKGIAARGGVMAAIAGLITQVTPIGQQAVVAWKGITAALAFQSKSPDPVTKLEAFSPVTAEHRVGIMSAIRDEIAQVDPNVLATAYYKAKSVPAYQRTALLFVTDSNSATGEETFFRSPTIGPIATARAGEHECLYVRNLGSMVDSPGQPKFDGILCPTFNLVRGDKLWTTEPANYSAMALKKSLKISGTEERLSGIDYGPNTPIVVIPSDQNPEFNQASTALWKRQAMNLENITKQPE